MPGFFINSTGGEANGPSNITETRRKHRWRFASINGVTSPSGSGPGAQALLLLQRAQRPKQQYEEAVLHHNQEEAYFAGKTKWDAITLSFYDAENNPDSSESMWNWINAVGPIPQANVNIPQQYKGQGVLEMVTGVGAISEQWVLYGCWPQSTNWNDLDYTSSEIQMIEVTMRYDRAVRIL